MARKSRKNVGLIGLGIIGSRVAAGLRAAGFHAFVWNRTPKPVPNFVGSPAEVAEICDIIQIFVADANATRDVIEALGDQIGPRHIIVSCGTIGPEATVELAQMVQARGAAFLDCPFTGSKGAAEKSQLVYYVGGDEDVFLRAKPALEATSKAIVRCGRVGDASTLKVATNLISAVTVQTLAEALAIVRSAGISAEAFSAALEQNACKSGVVELKLPKMVSGDYETHFSVKHMFKDVQIGIHLANQQQLEVPLTTVVGGVLYGALSNGWGDLDYASLYRTYTDAPPKTEQMALPPQLGEAAALTPEAPAVEAAPAQDSVAEPAPVVEPASEPAKEPEAAIEPALAEEAKAEDVKPAEPVAETAKIEEPKAEESMPEEAKAGDAKVEEPTVVAQDGAPAADAVPTSDTTPAASGENVGEPEEEAGLSGFFNRVFRRKGTPVGK